MLIRYQFSCCDITLFDLLHIYCISQTYIANTPSIGFFDKNGVAKHLKLSDFAPKIIEIREKVYLTIIFRRKEINEMIRIMCFGTVKINKFNKQDITKDEKDVHDEEKDQVNTHKMILELDNTNKEDKD